MRTVTLALLVLLSTGCVAGRVARVRQTFSEKWLCPIDRVTGEERERDWYAAGCDLKAVCQKPKGPCELVWTLGERTERARRDVMQLTGCPAEQLAFQFRREGMWATGCGKQLLCAEPTIPCVERVMPGCQDDARWEYDRCVEAAQDRGRHRRGQAWLNMNPIGGGINASIDETRAMNACEATRDAAIQTCVQRFSTPAPAPVVP